MCIRDRVAIPNGTLLHTSGIDKTGKLENMIDLPNGVYYVKELKTLSLIHI